MKSESVRSYFETEVQEPVDSHGNEEQQAESTGRSV